MTTLAITPSQAVPAAATSTAAVRPALADRVSGTTYANLGSSSGTEPLVFAVGATGSRLASVRVVIRDEAGSTVASFALAALSGTQNVIWTPRPGAAAGGYAAYWEGAMLATDIS
jgi:hypothetical protein